MAYRGSIGIPAAVVLAATLIGPAEANAKPVGVDLRLIADNLEIQPGQSATQKLTVTNRADTPTTAESRLVYVSPTFVNFEKPLPNGCAYQYQNRDPLISEIVECKIPAGLTKDRPYEVTFTMTTFTGHLIGTIYGTAIVSPDIGADPELNFADNATTPDATFGAAGAPEISGHVANVSFGSTVPLVPPGEIRPQTFTIGNQGPDPTKGPVRFVYTTPFYVNIADRQLPDGCKKIYSNPDPLTPEIMQCTLNLTGIGAASERQLTIDVTALKGGPSGLALGPAVAAEAREGEAPAHDPSLIDNTYVVGVMELP